MRPLTLILSLVALSVGSYWALTHGPLTPAAGEHPGAIPGLAIDTTGVEAAGGGGGEIPLVGSPPEGPRERRGEAVRPRVTVVTYAVEGRTARDVLRSLMEHGPRDGGDVFFGLTSTDLDVTYDPEPISGGCVIQNTRVVVDIQITLPEWLPGADVDPDLAADWSRFRRALTDHEDRHREIAVEGAEDAYDAVAELLRPTCNEANEEARRRLERLGVEVGAAHRRFDAETGHGKHDGAIWPQPEE